MSYDALDVRLDEAILDWLHQFSIEDSNQQWRIGQIAADYVDLFGREYGKSKIRQRIAVEAGISTSTVRDREAMHRFFPPEVREEFDVLTYHQLRVCKAAGESWREIAEWAVESADEFSGRPAPVEVIRHRVLEMRGKPAPTWGSRLRLIRRNAQRIVDDGEAPAGVVEALQVLLDSTQSTAKKFGVL